MAYIEVKERKKNKYYYRAVSIRGGNKISKRRIYLGKNLDIKELNKRIKQADILLNLGKKPKTLKEITPKIKKILIKNNIKRAGIFGSYARGEEKKNSDIDILIMPAENMGVEFIKLKLTLEKELGKKVDLVSYNGINPYLKKYILKEEVRII